MTSNRPIRRNPSPNQLSPEKPYKLIPFPTQPPTLKHPVGHDRYRSNCLHGSIELTLNVRTALHVSTGIVAMGSDVSSRVPLVKTMAKGTSQQLTIPGSSLKGVVRSIYEAITNSTLPVVTNSYKKNMPPERLLRNKKELCPASLVFGALDWQGLIHFTDAKCERTESVVGFMPSLYRPRPDQRRDYFQHGKAAGRKFYYHAVKAVDGGDRGIPVQQAGTEYCFTTHLQFMNLSQAELGTLLIALGQDSQYPFALKVGGGKPVGMGTMTVEVTAIEQAQNLRDRYTRYTPPDSNQLTGEKLQQFMQQAIQAAHKNLILEPQLQQLAEVLKFPTDRTAPEGMY
ncbi:RAMP superfamily CRISPR-associated protein [Pantanalinema rosaneae CENA516]|uniref:RAMP superfamily CRISPR-associated protein n=1 Tax=Pantanalinema rosaneae TaxID=1620701 RepID=UPI003D6E4356